jgi:hypothetical protein
MNGAAKINGNQSVGGGGGGVACGPSSVVVMNGGTISGNSAGNGAAVWVAYDRTFTMTGGQIHNNTGGSCVFVDSGTFDMQGGSISGNAGSAFNINGWGGNIRTLKMSGTAYIAPNNPVLFNDQCMTLQVTGGTPAATITPSAYTVGTQILSGSGVAASYTRFAITPNGGINYKIDSTGNLQIQP